MIKQKLWKVSLRGRLIERYNPSYVVAPDASTAYGMVRSEMDKVSCGFEKDRELLSVELLAEDFQYTEVGSRLFLPKE